MTDCEQYTPGPVTRTQVRKDGEKSTLILVKRTAPLAGKSVAGANRPNTFARVGSPFEGGASLGAAETTVRLIWAGRPTPLETRIRRADAPKLLEYGDIRWELEALVDGTRLTLWHNIDGRFISWAAAGWHICFDVLDCLPTGDPIGRMAGPEAMKCGGWQRLNRIRETVSRWKPGFAADTKILKPRENQNLRVAEAHGATNAEI